MNRHLNKKDRNVKPVMLREGTRRRGRVSEEGKGG
jgi:hypothetical protein